MASRLDSSTEAQQTFVPRRKSMQVVLEQPQNTVGPEREYLAGRLNTSKRCLGLYMPVRAVQLGGMNRVWMVPDIQELMAWLNMNRC
jgi:hypothetical protein